MVVLFQSSLHLATPCYTLLRYYWRTTDRTNIESLSPHLNIIYSRSLSQQNYMHMMYRYMVCLLSWILAHRAFTSNSTYLIVYVETYLVLLLVKLTYVESHVESTAVYRISNESLTLLLFPIHLASNNSCISDRYCVY